MSEKKYLLLTTVFVILSIIAGIAYVYFQNPNATDEVSVQQENPITSSNCSDETLYDFDSLDKALENPAAVCKLNLSKRSLETVLDEVFTLTNLEYLDLSYNFLTSLPSQTANLTRLKEIILNDNKIEQFAGFAGNAFLNPYRPLRQSNYGNSDRHRPIACFDRSQCQLE